MAYWLLKTEPEEFSWEDQVKRGAKGELWTGVRNFTARRNLKEMQKGDQAFFYHTGDEKQVVGIVEIIREHHPDPTAEAGEPWVVVDTRATKPMPSRSRWRRSRRRPVQGYGAGEIRPPVGAAGDAEHWKAVCKMGGLK